MIDSTVNGKIMLNLREPTNVLIFQVSVREKYRSSFESLYSSLLLLLLVYHRLIRISLLMASLSVADREFFLFYRASYVFRGAAAAVRKSLL